MHIPKYFELHELLPKKEYQYLTNKYSKERILTSIFDENGLITLDWMRKVYGKIVINDWNNKNQGILQHCGYRSHSFYQGVMSLSQHCFGRAFDLHFDTIEQHSIVREHIRENPDDGIFQYIGGVEEGSKKDTWLHIDFRPRIDGGILFFGVKKNV